VGNYKTAVQSAHILSIALGGDRHIHLDRHRKLALGPARVVPLAYLAHQYPEVKRRMLPLLKKGWGQVSPDHLEYWFLLREPRAHPIHPGSREEALLALLRDGPKSVAEMVSRLKLVHAMQIGAEELLREEVIGRAGLTPTDLMHIRGDFTAWDAEVAEAACTLFCRALSTEMASFVPALFERIAETLTHVIIGFLTGKSPSPTEDDWGHWFFHNSLYPSHAHLETSLRLKVPIIGIGAPAGLFLKRVAEMLHTDLVLPRYHEVANAIGAVAGNIRVSEDALVYPRLSADGAEVLGYFVQTTEGRDYIESLEEALEQARRRVRALAWEGAIRAGAYNPVVSLQEVEDGLDTYRIKARAIGNPRLA